MRMVDRRQAEVDRGPPAELRRSEDVGTKGGAQWGLAQKRPVLDAALIAAGQAAEHYEITRYGTLVAWAKQLGRNDCASVLQKNLEEEYAADKKLTALAESKINQRAVA